MSYPLEEPNGWFLKIVSHEHTREIEHYVPVQNNAGSWHVEFRRTVNSNQKINVAFGRGHSVEEAWARAKRLAESTDGQK